jgi:hypothetical protein
MRASMLVALISGGQILARPATADWDGVWGQMLWGAEADQILPALPIGGLITLVLLLALTGWALRARRGFGAATLRRARTFAETKGKTRVDEVQRLEAELDSLRVRLAELERSRTPRWRRLLAALSEDPRARAAFVIVVIALPAASFGTVVSLPHLFTNGTTADAQQVNENFSALAAEANAKDARIGSLEFSAALLQAQVDTNATDVQGLQSTFGGVSRSGDDLVFDGVNVQITDGSGSTDGATNGLGNLIVGYNEDGGSATHWGSHNLVLGMNNSYTSYAGLVAGEANKILGPFASVVGGISNDALGTHTTVVGGTDNKAVAYGSAMLGDSPNHLLLDVTNPPADCATCVAAVGDGVAGDGPAINESIVYACDNDYDGIYLPPGDYRVGSDDNGDFYSGVNIEANTCPDGLMIVGAGRDKTTLLPNSPTGQYVISICDDFVPGRYGPSCKSGVLNDRFSVKITRLRIYDDDVPGHSQSIEESHGIGMSQTGGSVIIEDIVIDTVGDEGIDINTAGGRVVVRDSLFIDPAAGAVSIYRCESVLVENIEARMTSGGTRKGIAIDIDPGQYAWTIKNVEIRNSSFLGDWKMAIMIQTSTVGLAGTEVRNVSIRNNTIETDPIAAQCGGGAPYCGSILVRSGQEDFPVHDVVIEDNVLEGAVIVDGPESHRIHIRNNRIYAPDRANNWGVRIKGLGSEVVGNHISGFERGCIGFEPEDTNGGSNTTLQLRIRDNFASCLSGWLGNLDPAIGFSSGTKAPPDDDDKGYLDISNNHIDIAAGSSVRLGIHIPRAYKNVRIAGNDITRDPTIDIPSSWAIYAAGAPLAIENNMIDGTWTGVMVTDTHHGKVSGNEIEIRDASSSRGIELHRATNVLVTGNVIHGAGASGSRATETMDSSDRIICTNNISMGSGGTGPGGVFSCGSSSSSVGVGCEGTSVGDDSICDINIVGS